MGNPIPKARSRITKELLLSRAEFLPVEDRAIVRAHLDLGMSVREIATLHRMPHRSVRRRIDRLGEMLADPCFLLAAQYGNKLPPELLSLAKAYWCEGRPLREIALLRTETLHAIRRQIAVTRSLLLMQLAAERDVPHTLARQALAGRYITR